MKLIQILSTSPNGKIFRVRFRYGQLLNYSEWTDYVRFNLIPHKQYCWIRNVNTDFGIYPLIAKREAGV